MTTSAKSQLRDDLKKIRNNIAKREFKTKQLNERLLAHPALEKVKSVALYLAVQGEVDIIDSLQTFPERNIQTCLPVVIAKDAPLIFRKWNFGGRLENGAFNIDCPPSDAEEIIPELIILPLLGFDLDKNRLGYGGGFYDRTLEKIASISQVLTIGVGFDEQYVQKIPTEEFDQSLDFLVTPTKSL